MSNKRAKPPVNVERLTTWEMTDEVVETYSTTANDFTRRTMTYRDTLSSNSTELRGDGVPVDRAVAIGAGTLELGIHALSDEESKSFFGETVVNGTNVTTGDDIPKYQAVALQTRTRDGLVNLKKWFKVQFSPSEENVTQKAENVTYSTSTLNGTYLANKAGQFRAKKSGLDPVSDAEFINKWFSDPTFIGETE